MSGPRRFLPIDGRALRLYRDHFAQVFLVAGIVFAPLSLVATLVNHRADDLFDDGGSAPVVGVLVLVASALMLFGYALCAGLLDKLVVGPEFGHPRVTFPEALRTLPYAKLIALDLLTTVGIAIGLLLGIVPGIVFFTFAALAPPLLVTEQQGVMAALRHSASLVRRSFWLTFFVVTLPVLVEHEIFAAVELAFDLPLVLLWLLHLLASVLVLAVVLVCETTLALTLASEEKVAALAAPVA